MVYLSEPETTTGNSQPDKTLKAKAEEIRKQVEMLGRHLMSYEDYLAKLGNSLGTSVNHYNNAYKQLSKIDKDVAKITEGRPKIEVKQIEKPSIEE